MTRTDPHAAARARIAEWCAQILAESPVPVLPIDDAGRRSALASIDRTHPADGYPIDDTDTDDFANHEFRHPTGRVWITRAGDLTPRRGDIH